MMGEKRTFQTKQWKLSAAISYVAMHVGLLIVTGVLPLTFVGMGESGDIATLALHCYSFRKIQYWLLGVGGGTFLVSTMAVIAAMSRNRKFRITVAALFCLPVFSTFSILMAGLVATEKRRSYFHETWNDMSTATKNFIQNYCSCCGFDGIDEWNTGALTAGSSCYADEAQSLQWRSGCYDQITSLTFSPISLTNQTIGDEKMNPLAFTFIFSFTLLILIQILSALMLIKSLIATPNYCDDSEEVALENVYATSKDHFSRDAVINTSTEQNGCISVQHGATMDNGNIQTEESSIQSEENEVKGGEQQEQNVKVWHVAFTDAITKVYEEAFYWIGVQVARHPKMTIVYSVLLTVTFTVGILQRYEDAASAATGFLADDNQVVKEASLTSENFLVQDRDQYILIVDDTNVLLTDKFQTALDIDKSIKLLSSSIGSNFSSICLKLNDVCEERSLFEFWSFNNTILESLTLTDILAEINKSPLISPVFGGNVDISLVIGGIEQSQDGDITSAKAHLLHYVTTSIGGDWEDLFVEVAQKAYNGVDVYVQARSSRITENSSQFSGELPLLFAGFCLIFIYIIFMAGKFSLLEHRTYVALMGVTAAGLSMASGIGLTPTFGLKWTVLHLIVPFLVIGIGVDDMFVLLQTWNSIEDDPTMKMKSMEEKSGRVLRIAGVSITVTSATDLVAFAVGATSELGGFSSFSIFVAICIIMLFFLQCTFFMACVVLDIQRRDRRYDACLACCYKHDNSYKAGKCSEREIVPTFFEDCLGRVVTKLPFAIVVILLTFILSSVMAWGFSKLKVSYDPDWYLPSTSYLVEYGNQYGTYFNPGEDAAAYVIDADFYAEREKLHKLYTKLRVNSDVNSAYLTSWFEDYVTWAGNEKAITNVYAQNAFVNSTEFYTSVTEFLASTDGRKHVNDVSFKSGVIIGSRFGFRHRQTADDVQNVDIIARIRSDCEESNFSSYAFPYGRSYLRYEIVRIIGNEVYRNLGITLLAVLIMILPVLASLQMGLWVGLCVVFTTIDVAGTMYFAGLSIESSTIITLLLSVGLAVDYAAHIGHKFLCLKGSRKKRVRVAVGQIGVAVFNGGFSTFLALVLLSGSQTYTFRIFFTIFVCVVGFGLWNGLVFLPCILSIIGPAPHASASEARLSSRHYLRKNKVNGAMQEVANGTQMGEERAEGTL